MNVDRLEFAPIQEAYPERWDKCDLAQMSITETEPGEYCVQREPNSDAHVAHLAIVLHEPYGKCSCDGYEYHDGPCSHLCGLWRAHQAELIQIPRGRPQAVTVDVVDAEEEQAQQAIADGGRPYARTHGHTRA